MKIIAMIILFKTVFTALSNLLIISFSKKLARMLLCECVYVLVVEGLLALKCIRKTRILEPEPGASYKN